MHGVSGILGLFSRSMLEVLENVNVASPINCDVGVLVSFLNLVYNKHIREVFLKIHRVLFFLFLTILMLALEKWG
jgi:hypothetical protein